MLIRIYLHNYVTITHTVSLLAKSDLINHYTVIDVMSK